ncbi:MAG: beta-galactosidase [Clostridiales bacterium]|jgi:beta-galactosidase|nr:beta-galactosidase [Clostridiales bacterium]
MAYFWDSTLIHGGDYNPDQWLDRPDILAKDIELMKKAHINSASVAIFAWSNLEPQEGVYKFEWLKNIIDNLYNNGIYTILATPTGARPRWLAGYEETNRVNRDLVREHPGERHNHCYTSPIMREKTRAINMSLAQSFAGHPGIILWHLSNEYGGECYCPLCRAAFRAWLKAKYGTLGNLNHEWWSHFWSHTYTSWDQIEPPINIGDHSIHGLSLDWKRFVTHQTADFCAWEKQALRDGGSRLPVTINMMGFYNGVNYFKFRDIIDIGSWDSYPCWHTTDDIRLAALTAATHDKMRSVTGKNFLLMESTPSMTNWSHVSKNKRPGMHMLSSIQAIAHGSNSVQYFQWRKGRGGAEKFHGAVVGHDGGGDTRVFKDAQEVGACLKELSHVAQTSVNAQVAIIHDMENKWAMEDAAGPRRAGLHYDETIIEHYRPFWEMGIAVDIPDMGCNFDKYKVVVAPMLYMYREDIQNKLRKFAQSGGTLIMTYWSGIVNENDLCWEGAVPFGLTDVFGIESYEIDALDDSEGYDVRYDGKVYRLTELAQRVRLISAGDKPSKILAEYQSDFCPREIALTKKQYGVGMAYYLAGKLDSDFIGAFYRQLAVDLSLTKAVDIKLPYGVVAGRRGETLIFQNYNKFAVSFGYEGKIIDMPSYSVKIV